MTHAPTVDELVAKIEADGGRLPEALRPGFRDAKYLSATPSVAEALRTLTSAPREDLVRRLKHATVEGFDVPMTTLAKILGEYAKATAANAERFHDKKDLARENGAALQAAREAMGKTLQKERDGLGKARQATSAAIDGLVAKSSPKPKDPVERLTLELRQSEARRYLPAPEVIGLRPDGSTITTWDLMFPTAPDETREAMAAGPAIVVPGNGKPGSMPRFAAPVAEDAVRSWRISKLEGNPDFAILSERLADVQMLDDAITAAYSALDQRIGGAPEPAIAVSDGAVTVGGK
jgi:hypothetical protein